MEYTNSRDIFNDYTDKNAVIPYKGGFAVIIKGRVKEIHFNKVKANKRLKELKDAV